MAHELAWVVRDRNGKIVDRLTGTAAEIQIEDSVRNYDRGVYSSAPASGAPHRIEWNDEKD